MSSDHKRAARHERDSFLGDAQVGLRARRNATLEVTATKMTLLRRSKGAAAIGNG
jgi:hypothetical protein